MVKGPNATEKHRRGSREKAGSRSGHLGDAALLEQGSSKPEADMATEATTCRMSSALKQENTSSQAEKQGMAFKQSTVKASRNQESKGEKG